MAIFNSKLLNYQRVSCWKWATLNNWMFDQSSKAGPPKRFPGRPGPQAPPATWMSWGWVKTLVPSEPQIAGKWMFISLKMVSIDIDPSPVDPNPFQLDFLLRLPQVSGKLHAALADKARPAPSPTRPLTQQQGSRSEMPATGSARNGSTSLVKWTEYHGMCMSTQFFRGFSA